MVSSGSTEAQFEMARRAKAVAEDVLVEGLRGIEEQVEGLLETFEIASDKKLLRNIKASLREAQKGRGRTISEILAGL
jgi:hypothetical protein